jgi:threonine dehydrogenase-like Zn-dependent dehydrogenase
MRALVWEAPEVMRIREVAEPAVQPGWVRIRVGSVGICGSEVGAYLGHNELRVPPLVMGHEWAGVVDAVGSPEDGAWVGRTVTVNPFLSCGHCRACLRGERQLCAERRIIGIDLPGAFGEWVAAPVANLLPVSDPVAGALVEPLACAVRAVRLGAVEPGDRVLVYGAGIIGLMCAWMARQVGALGVLVTDPNARRLGEARRWGATDTASKLTLEDIRRWAPDGADVVLDGVGLGVTRRQGIEAARRGGRVVLVGLHEPDATVPGNRMVRDEIVVRGSFSYTDEDFRVARDFVEQGILPERGPWLDIRPVEAGDAAFREQAAGDGPYAKILLTFSGVHS